MHRNFFLLCFVRESVFSNLEKCFIIINEKLNKEWFVAAKRLNDCQDPQKYINTLCNWESKW